MKVIGEGRFLAVIATQEGEFVCKTDDYGQETLFLYRCGTDWALSNSFMYLGERVRSSGRALSTREDVLRTFMVANQSLFGGQLLSHDTPYDEIKLVPIDNEVVIGKPKVSDPVAPSLTVRPTYRRTFDITTDTYCDYLNEYVMQWGARFNALANSDIDGVEFDLSGGYDTRLCLSLILASGNSDKYSYFTNKNIPDDYAVAKILISKYGLNPATRSVDLSTVDECASYDIWRWGSAGVYAPIRTPKSVVQSARSFKITGAYFRGRDFESKSYKSFLNVFKNSLKDDYFEQVYSLYGRGVNALGAEESDPRARGLHYREFRARIHYGRSWAANFNEVIVTPKMSLLFEALENFRRKSLGLSPWDEQVPADIYGAVDKDLLDVPFDKPEKALSRRCWEASRSLGLSVRDHSGGRVPRVYKGRSAAPSHLPVLQTEKQSFARKMLENFSCAAEDARVVDIFGRQYVDKAWRDIEEKEFKHSRVYHQLGRLSAILASYEIIR